MQAKFRNHVATLATALMLGWLAGCAGTGQKVGTAVDDTAITTKVKAEMAKDKDVSATEVHVRTVNGRVNLSGQVKSFHEKRKAETIARNVSGVNGVDNELTVGNN